MTGWLHRFTLRRGYPAFNDLPWHLPLARWKEECTRLEQVPVGVSRHPVVFVNYSGRLFALKELPPSVADKEYNALMRAEELHLPAVTPVGYTQTRRPGDPTTVLITCFLEHSIPYRSLFSSSRLVRYRAGLLDAVAGLLVQLHMSGIYWGDCSLSNTLYRRDAGALSAYMVDAETSRFQPGLLSPVLRHQDLDIMEDNVDSDLEDLIALDYISEGIPIRDTGAYIRQRYRSLWDEINHEELLKPGENFRIQERIRALNTLGFSVGDVALDDTPDGSAIRLRVRVAGRNFHRDQLFDLTGVEAEEMQARKLMNEIQEVKATLSQAQNRATTLSAAAYHWLENIYRPTVDKVKTRLNPDLDEAELYCQVLEHKWYISERERRDVGHNAASEDYLKSIYEK